MVIILYLKNVTQKGIKVLNLIQSDMQLMYFDKQILSLYKKYFRPIQKNIVIIYKFSKLVDTPQFFYRTKQKQEFFFKKKLFYKFFIDKSLGISDTGIFLI